MKQAKLELSTLSTHKWIIWYNNTKLNIIQEQLLLISAYYWKYKIQEQFKVYNYMQVEQELEITENFWFSLRVGITNFIPNTIEKTFL